MVNISKQTHQNSNNWLPRKIWQRLISVKVQCAKKVVSDSLGQVDFAVGQEDLFGSLIGKRNLL